MPNHQIVECYIVFTALEAAKKNEDPHATVCPDLSNHEIFERWRTRDAAASCPRPHEPKRAELRRGLWAHGCESAELGATCSPPLPTTER